jgi:hypothetical protein
MKVFSRLVMVFAFLFAGISASAQNPNQSLPAQSTASGFTGYETFQGSVDSFGSLFKLDSSVGYDFNRHVGVFAGIPLYFTHDFSGRTSSTRLDGRGAGDLYFGIDVFFPHRWLDYSSSFTVGLPTGTLAKGFSTGHRTLDWNNKFRHRFKKLTPFVDAGISNTVPDTELVTRTFTSRGNVVHLEEGAEYDLPHRVYVGASAYHVLPFGNQQVFAFTSIATDGQPSASGLDLTRENGFDSWIGFEPTRVLRLELGYSRSVTFALNRLSFNVGVNVGKLLRRGSK